MSNHQSAAILTLGSELTEGLRVDTNSAEIAFALGQRGFIVEEMVSAGDDVDKAASILSRLIDTYPLVVTTGGLGPTHDDITRDAAAQALGVSLVRDARLEQLLEPVFARHRDGEAARQVFVQADVVPGSEIIDATTGTAPGLVIATRSGVLALLPGPPSEMRPMLDTLLKRFDTSRARPRDLGVTGMAESDVQVAAQRALEGRDGIRLTVLARPGDVRIILLDEGAGAASLDSAAQAVAREIGDNCYSVEGLTLAQEVVRLASSTGVKLSVAESCTGGLLSGALTAVPGASECFLGGVVAYDNDVKVRMLGVPEQTLESHGSVSEQTALAMAEGARTRLASDVSVSVTGIAGPEGGTSDKPVGLVWFGVASVRDSFAVERRFPPTSRDAIRERSVATALELLRGEVLKR